MMMHTDDSAARAIGRKRKFLVLFSLAACSPSLERTDAQLSFAVDIRVPAVTVDLQVVAQASSYTDTAMVSTPEALISGPRVPVGRVQYRLIGRSSQGLELASAEGALDVTQDATIQVVLSQSSGDAGVLDIGSTDAGSVDASPTSFDSPLLSTTIQVNQESVSDDALRATKALSLGSFVTSARAALGSEPASFTVTQVLLSVVGGTSDSLGQVFDGPAQVAWRERGTETSITVASGPADALTPTAPDLSALKGAILSDEIDVVLQGTHNSGGEFSEQIKVEFRVRAVR